MDEHNLTVREVAELKSCTERYVRVLIERGKLTGIEVTGLATGQGGIQYRIPLSSLDNKLQLKYKRLQRKKEITTELPLAENIAVDNEDLSASEREEIAFWKVFLGEWRQYRSTSGLSKREADEEFIRLSNIKNPDLKLSYRMLCRKWEALNEAGEAALIDRRGKHGKHKRKLTQDVWDIFEAFYLDESQKSVKLCVSLTELEINKLIKEGIIQQTPQIPSEDTFIREVNKLPLPILKYFREGLKTFIGECEPYIKRMYDNLEPNDIWVADNHTFDIMLYDSGKTLRLYLTAFMDVRTRKMMGWCVTDRPCSDATIYALKKGIENYGIPKMLYTDNGREFLFHDFGGNGFRKKKVSHNEFKPPTILKQLGIEFRTALPRNARAKGVERAFRTVKETFSKLFEAYTGGNVVEKPERLKEVVKNPDKLKRVEEFTGFVDTWLAGWYNKQPHTGEGMFGRSPDEAFAEMLVEQRRATEAQLNLMFMRWSNPMKLSKNGVTLTFYGKKLQYSEESIWLNYFGKEVYIRYTPDDLSKVRIYDMDEKFVGTAHLLKELGYDASKEAIAEETRERRSATRAVSSYKKLKGIKTHDALELMIEKAAENLAAGEDINPKLIRPVFSGERLTGNIAVGQNMDLDEEVDWTAALRKLKKSREDE